jgi:NTE family protein
MSRFDAPSNDPLTDPRTPTGTALVLAGGGLVGIGWEVGVLLGLRDAGVAASGWDRIVGTSAGSVVGAALGSTDGLERLAATDWVAYGEELAQYMAGLDRDAVARIDALWFGDPDGPDRTTCAEIGRLARAAVTGPADRFEGAMAAILPDDAWPVGLRITAIDAEDGSLRLLDAASGVPLAKAVAASCSVPGVFPPVAIDGRLYVDGGVRSGSGLDLAAGSRSVVGVAPIRQDGHGERQLVTESATLAAGGSRVVLVRPTTAADVMLPTDSLDAGQLPDAVRAGRAAGLAEAEAVQALIER